MDTPATTGSAPVLSVRLTLAPELARRFEQGLQAAAIPAVEAAIAELLRGLGIPGSPAVSWQPTTGALAAGRPLALEADGRLCRYNEELMVALASYVQGSVLAPLDAPLAWLVGAAEPAAAEWLALLCRHALGQHAGALLGAEQARALCGELATLAGGPAFDPQRTAPILARALDLGLSLADRGAVAAALGDSDGDADARAERLIAALRPSRVEIRIERSYVRQLSLAHGARAPELFRYMREGLYGELGVSLPPFQFIPDDGLRPGAIVFVLNHLPGVPLIGLPPGHLLVSDTPDRLGLLGQAAVPALNPATAMPSSLAPEAALEPLEAAGLTTWDGLAYVILSLAGELRKRCWRLVDAGLAGQMLEQIGRTFPELKAAAGSHLALEQLTAVLRGLVAEQISIQNLPRILQLLLEYELFVRPGAPTAERLSYVRAGLGDAIAYRITRGATALVVYLLDPAVERRVAAPGGSQEVAQELLDALRAELAHLPATAAWPPLLVSEPAYAPLQAIVADELPRLRVLSFPQLPPNLNVQPVARIMLDVWRR